MAVRIPKSFAEEMGFEDSSPAEMSLDDGALVIKPDKDRVWDLGTLLAAVTDENIHPAWETETVSAADAEDAPGDDG